MFMNCPKTFNIDKMEAVSFDVPTATDNSGLVKNVTVNPPNFKPGTVVSSDTNVTYTAVDNSGNTATCTLTFRIKGIKLNIPQSVVSHEIFHFRLRELKSNCK
jgi:hypothetical protein